jgi:hypothetical protein
MPYLDTLRLPINSRRNPEVLVAFRNVRLINTNSIDPNDTLLVSLPEVYQRHSKIYSDREIDIFELDGDSIFCVSPDIRESLISRV